MNLDPRTYACGVHSHDLTPQVAQALGECGPPVAFRRSGRWRSFEVIVSCPGGDGQDEAHDLACTGKYWRR